MEGCYELDARFPMDESKESGNNCQGFEREREFSAVYIFV